MDPGAFLRRWLQPLLRLNPNAAFDALRRRYVRGEISRAEYEQLLEELGEKRPRELDG